MISLNIYYLPPPNTVTQGIGASTYEFWRSQVSPSKSRQWEKLALLYLPQSKQLALMVLQETWCESCKERRNLEEVWRSKLETNQGALCVCQDFPKCNGSPWEGETWADLGSQVIPLAAAWEILERAAWRQGYGVKGSDPGQIKGWRSGRCRDEKCSGDKMKEIGA